MIELLGYAAAGALIGMAAFWALWAAPLVLRWTARRIRRLR